MQQPRTSQNRAVSQNPDRVVTAVRPAHNRQELDALELRRNELKNQLESLGDRRGEAADQLREAGPSTAPSIQGRLNAIDDRITDLERELMQTDDAITDAIARGITTSQQWHDITNIDRSSGNTGEIVTVMFGEALFFALLGIVLFRRMRRPSAATAVRLAPEETSRLDQLQRAVDVIAVEVERISEGQRYVAKIFGDKQPAIGAGAAQDVAAARREGQPARKRDSAS